MRLKTFSCRNIKINKNENEQIYFTTFSSSTDNLTKRIRNLQPSATASKRRTNGSVLLTNTARRCCRVVESSSTEARVTAASASDVTLETVGRAFFDTQHTQLSNSYSWQRPLSSNLMIDTEWYCTYGRKSA